MFFPLVNVNNLLCQQTKRLNSWIVFSVYSSFLLSISILRKKVEQWVTKLKQCVCFHAYTLTSMIFFKVFQKDFLFHYLIFGSETNAIIKLLLNYKRLIVFSDKYKKYSLGKILIFSSKCETKFFGPISVITFLFRLKTFLGQNLFDWLCQVIVISFFVWENWYLR